MKVMIVHRGNLLVDFLNSTGAIHDVRIQVSIGKSKIILISFSTQPIGRGLAYQVDRQRKFVPNLDDFMYHQIGERAKIAGAKALLFFICIILPEYQYTQGLAAYPNHVLPTASCSNPRALGA